MNSALQAMWQDSADDGSVRQRLYQVLRQSIIRMVLAPGQALSEKELADTLAISRQPVREAFIRLSEAGLVEVRPQRGTYVIRISRQAVLEARFVREALEVAVAREAAVEGMKPRALDELHELIERQRRCVDPEDYDRFFLLDEAFHRTLALGVDQQVAWKVTEEVKAQLDRVRYLSVPDSTPIRKLIDQHAAVVEAVDRRDGDAAEAAMRVHQREILQSLPELVQRFPAMFDVSAQPERGAVS
ncbi:GntR family transcriptional regulator [Aidingimonas halophila]|uniref:DNA-binding transcriptional regulator, GntR family n=1 Tax=Aidingimonas halophila TaxID=574349 RepID=A0A1H3FPT2_9GAMM|nr:GntR family transcriptional regulator [Aidingimonas halophila]GHC38268.1 GntR family transcriptional regulator [Aidingimonas halophila]SDX92981.1 DNA-binding transcriptional regulator, GntR family [Aidingimonas halophila]